MAAPSSIVTLEAALREAVTHHLAGRLQQAVQLYRAILQYQPDHAEANHNLGVLARQAGDDLASLPYLERALASDPTHHQYALSYADALLASGQSDEALTVLQAAMLRGLDSAQAQSLLQEIEVAAHAEVERASMPTADEMTRLVELFNAGHFLESENRAGLLLTSFPHAGLVWKVFGAAILMQGKDALPALQKAAELLPLDAEAHCNLGHACQERGQFERAVESYRRALQIDPGFADAHRDLGNVYSDLGQHELAAASFRRAIEIQTDCSELYSNLGNALKELGQYDAAVASYGRALELNPAYSGAHNNLGNALKELGQIDAAISSYRQALQTDPGFAEAHCNLGVALSDLRRFDDAVACYCKALELKPDHAWAHCNLGNARKDLGQLDQALACYRRALQIKPDFADAHSNLLFTLNYRSDQSAAALLSEARRYGDSVARRARASESWSNPADPARRLRVGLVSGDLRDHPVAYFIEGVLAALASTASERIELYAYSNHFHEDAFSAKIKQSCRNWLRAKALSDEQLAQRIRNDGIDILIDLSGHTAHNRLPMFAWKPAPVQLSWLGYFATTGVAAIDYFLADPWTLPHAEECNFTEKIWRFPQSRLCFTPPAELIEAGPLPALLNCHISFACFNDLAKINDSVIAVWARVLAAVPNSRLLLKARQLADPVARQDMLDRFARHGIAAARLLLEGPSSRIDYLQTYRQVDIVLDTFPFPGGTTTAEALWMGVPVLTLAGGGFLSRQGVGLLMNAGLPEWVASDVEDFVARALTHASDLPALAALRGRLRQQVLCSPVFDAAGFAQHFESALRDIWVGWCDEQAAKP